MPLPTRPHSQQKLATSGMRNVAISNSRIQSIADGKVSFSYKDYRQDGQKKIMPLDALEFIRRFLQHILPSGFHKIRYYGILATRNRKTKLAGLQGILGYCPADQCAVATGPEAADDAEPRVCPDCGAPALCYYPPFAAWAPAGPEISRAPPGPIKPELIPETEPFFS
ncbi:MAG: transposase [Saprospiraceae bacterium]